MIPTTAKRLLNATYLTAGLAVKERCVQAMMRAYLGPGALPLTPDEELQAMPFLIRLNNELTAMVKEHGAVYDFGQRSEVAPADPRAILEAPNLRALLDLMQAEQQSVGQAVAELDVLRETTAVLLTHLRAVKGQNDASVSSIQSLLDGIQPFPDGAAKLLGGGL